MRELERGELVELGADEFEAVMHPIHFLSLRRSDREKSAISDFVDWVLMATA